MTSLVVRTAARTVVPIVLVWSLYLLWRGHNEPGGGFVGGLVASTAFILRGLADGVAATRRLLRVDPRAVAALGVLVALAAGAAGLVAGAPFLTGLWIAPGGVPLGTPLLFDVGVYLVVVGAAVAFFEALASGRRDPSGAPEAAAADGEEPT